MSNTTTNGDTTSASGTGTAAKVFIAPTDSNLVQLFRFGLTGVLAMVFDYATLLSLYSLAHVWQPVAVIAGNAVGLVICYVCSIKWVFPHRSMSDKRAEFTIFVLIGVVGTVLTVIIMELLVRLLNAQQGILVPLVHAMQSVLSKCVAVVPALASRGVTLSLQTGNVIAAKFAAIVIVFFFNFVARKALLFARPKTPDIQPSGRTVSVDATIRN
jgi:putative flippase GtrA